jgi:hypothetical protein
MDDETFMANMNVNSSHSQEYWSQYGAPQPHKEDDELDEDGEGLMDGPRGRAANYTMEEDQLLCKAWCNIGMDPTVGVDQKQETHWVLIKEYFDGENTSGIERFERSFHSHWGGGDQYRLPKMGDGSKSTWMISILVAKAMLIG